MKNAGMTIDFKNDQTFVFGKPEKLATTNSDHYVIPITNYGKLLNNVIIGKHENVMLINKDNISTYDIALKLHRQFAHPTPEKLIKLLNSAGQPGSSNDKLKESIAEVTKECSTCQVYQGSPPHPIVRLPLATSFKECIAMDLKFYKGHILLHLVDHATRLSASTEIKLKNPYVIIEAILHIWIQVYEPAENFLSGNGGEFVSQDFLDICEAMNTCVHTTAAKSPFSNGLIECHNLILLEMLDKFLENQNINFQLALAWCTNTKNSLANVHGFSPFQLAIGQNPVLPSMSHDKPPVDYLK